MFEGKTILITGGTGSLGHALTKKLLNSGVEAIRIFSRNESNQIAMESNFDDKRLRFFVGDIRDSERLFSALENVDIVFHAAALKHVPKIEYNPFESIKTNVIGSQNVIDNSLKQNVEKVVCVGTDKAVSPLNTYGATKLLMEKLFVSANNYINTEKHRTKFVAVRYGNVLGSSGSVIPRFIDLIKKNKPITITDSDMTRFTITMDEALEFILNATIFGKGSEIFIPKLKSYEMSTLIESLNELCGEIKQEFVGIRPGEKFHETLINHDEILYAWQINDMYMLANPHYQLFNDQDILENYPGIEKITEMKSYSSDTTEKITKQELKEKILELGLI
jgi:UDP-N-acetylglucosamine 4,6-dehydratase/UDP-glucose 4-epimerase|tara:strand:- start:4860 stop:5864 length:1005 start_codon:yes stop_codon:yes gene_type:complete